MAKYIHQSADGTIRDDQGNRVTAAALVATGAVASTFTQTYSTADATVAAPTAATPALTAANPAALTSTDLTDSSGGTAADTIAALSDGTTYANDVAAIRSNFASLARQGDRQHVDLGVIRAEVVKLVTDLTATNAEVTKLVADDLDNRRSITAIIDALQAAGLVG